MGLAQEREQGGAAATVSRQPRLPQRQTQPSSSTVDVAELAGHAARPVVEPAAHTSPAPTPDAALT